MFDNESKPVRHFTFRILILEIILFVATMPWYTPRPTDHFTWIICCLLAGYPSWKDYKNGFFDKQTLLYLLISIVLIVTTIYFLVFYQG